MRFGVETPLLPKHLSSWADEIEEVVEEGGGALPPPTETIRNGYKIITEYKYNEDNKKVKVVRTYRIERRVVSKTIAHRKNWKKFGQAAKDKPGPNPSTTFFGEDVYMQFITNKEDQDKPEEDPMDKLKSMGEKGVVKCRTCQGDHWTLKCPFKDTNLALAKAVDDKKPLASATPAAEDKGGKYIPPSLRDGGNKSGQSMNKSNRDNELAIRVSNLSESTQDGDLEDLVKPFGPISKLYLAKDKATGLCKGFAYIHFKHRADAAKAIQALDKHGYDHLILNVNWSKQPEPGNTTR